MSIIVLDYIIGTWKLILEKPVDVAKKHKFWQFWDIDLLSLKKNFEMADCALLWCHRLVSLFTQYNDKLTEVLNLHAPIYAEKCFSVR